ncbi:MAG: DM13 domain-containing protein [Acidobacteria bacterium]|nr:DM13 domain-containing protein [Acidobacteriota bacterium]
MNRVKEFVKRRPLVSAIAAAIVLGVGAWLVFGFFGFQTLFIDEEVAEANPFVAGPGASGLAADETTEEMADAMNEAMDDAGKSGDDPVDEPMAEGVTTLAEGSFIGRGHPTTGLAKVITDGNQRFLRFEGFETDNGPDLNVYLATGPPDGSPEDFIDLGDLKGNIGDQNYELPDDVDLDRYTTVFIWCVRFSVAFGAAPLA